MNARRRTVAWIVRTAFFDRPVDVTMIAPWLARNEVFCV